MGAVPGAGKLLSWSMAPTSVGHPGDRPEQALFRLLPLTSVFCLPQILVPDPSKRCSVADIVSHPWFQDKLPSEMRDRFGADPGATPRQYRQHPDITSSLIEAAVGHHPDGQMDRLGQQPHHESMSMAEQAQRVQRMLLEERQQQEQQERIKQEQGAAAMEQ